MLYQIYGAERTGTNLLKYFLPSSLSNEVQWKHGHPLTNKDYVARAGRRYGVVADAAIVMIKDPYSWYDSIQRWRARTTGNFNPYVEFTRFNLLYYAHIQLLEGADIYKPTFQEAHFIRYEDLLMQPDEEMEKVGVKLEKGWVMPERLDQSGNSWDREREKMYRKGFPYGLSKDVIKLVTELTDWNVARYYGYDYRSL